MGLVVALLVAGLQVLPATPAAAAVPSPPAAVTPTPSFSVVNGSGPTSVSGEITADTVWGPQGSPYVVTDWFRVKEQASLTMLPGTVVKMGPGAEAYIHGQLLVLGDPKHGVVITSLADDSVGGDTNGDGGTTSPSAGDWDNFGIDPGVTQASLPPSVVDYATFRYGGGAPTGSCGGRGLLDLGENSRAIVSNSSFTHSSAAGIRGGAGDNGFTGVYDNYFADSKCGGDLSFATNDWVGNTFHGSFGTAAVWAQQGEGRFWFNTVDDLVVFSQSPVDVRYNSLTKVGKFGTWDQQLQQYQSNWWGSDPPQPSAGGCMTLEEVNAVQPPVTSHADYENCSVPNLYVGDGWRLQMLPALHEPPHGLSDDLARPYASQFGPVDTFHGTLSYAATDLKVADAGEALTAGRVYRQDKLAEDGDFGAGWTMSYTEAVDDTVLGLGDGSSVSLPPCDGNMSVTRDPGVSAACVTDQGETKVTTADNLTYVFNTATGLLARMLLGDPGHVVSVNHTGGLVSQVVGESGRTLSYARNASDQVSAITDSQSRAVSYGYNGAGQLTSVTGVDEKTTTYTYSEDKLASVTTPNGVTALAVGYDDQDRVSWVEQAGQGRADIDYDSTHERQITQADDTVITQLVDQHGRLVTESVDGGPTSHLVYDGDGRLVASIPGVPTQPMTGYAPPATMAQYDVHGNLIVTADGLGRLTRVTYSDAHRPLVVTAPDGAQTTFTYDTNDRLMSMVDARNKEWLVDNNGRGQMTSLIDPVGREQSWTYETDGDLASHTDELGGTTTYTNTPEGWPSTQTDPLDRSTSYDYTPWGEVAATTLPRGGEEVLAFDDDRNLASSTDPLDRVTSYGYDTHGRLHTITDPLDGVTTIEYDTLGRVATLTDAADQSFTRSYTAEGWLATVTDAADRTTTMSYDPAGRPVRVTDPLGRITQTVYNRGDDILRLDHPDGTHETFGYDRAGRQTDYTDPLGGEYQATYDAAGNQTALEDPLGHTELRSYDAIGRVTSVTDPLQRVVDYTYANSGRKVTLTDSLGLRSIAELDTAGELVTETDGDGAQTSYGYNDDGLLTTITEPGNHTTHATYDLAGQQTTLTDANNDQTSYHYDDLGRVAGHTYPDQSADTYDYDAVGNLTGYTNRTNDTWTYAYDDVNRLTTLTDPLDAVTSYTYDDADRPTTLTDPTGVVTHYAYDPMDRVAVTWDSHDAATVITYDDLGNPLSVTDPANQTTNYTYDALGQLKTETYPGVLGVVTYTYDAVGNLKSRNQDKKTLYWSYDDRDKLTASTNGLGKTTSYTYDLAGRVTSQTSPLGKTTSYTYNTAGRLHTVTEPGALVATYGYRPTGELNSVTLPSQAAYQFGYDNAGHLHTQTDPLGNTTTYDVDPEGRLLSTELPSGATISSTYDPLGRELTRTAGTSTRNFTYDDAGRLTQAGTTNPTTTVEFTYDDRGLLDTSTDQTGTTNYQHNQLGQTTQIDPPIGTTADLTYNAVGDQATIRGPVNLNYTYNESGWLTTTSNAATTNYAGQSYTYYNDGSPKQVSANTGAASATYNDDGQMATSYLTFYGITNPAEGTTTYTRDTSGRLTGAQRKAFSGSVQQTDTYQWDDDSNRTQITKQPTGQAAVTTNATYDDAGRLETTTTGGATTNYTYNDDGQLTDIDRPGAGQDVTYTYDGFGELASAHLTTPTTTSSITYDHDAFGRVTTREHTSGSTTNSTDYGYRGAETDPVTLTDQTGTTALVRDATGRLISAIAPSGATSHAFANVHGDIVGWMSQVNGAFTSVNTYDPFGTKTQTNGPGTGPGATLPIGFQADPTDPSTGLVDMNARAYDPDTGRFTSQDTIIGDPGIPESLNRYAYGNASPTDHVDPTGHSAQSFFMGVACKTKMSIDEFARWMSNHARSVYSSFATAFQGSAAQHWLTDIGTWMRGQDTSDFHKWAMWLGFIPVIGDAIDVVDGLVYLSEGDYTNAAISIGAAIPFIGSSVAAAFRGGKILNKLSGGLAHDAVGAAASWTRKALTHTGGAAREALSIARRHASSALSIAKGAIRKIGDTTITYGQRGTRTLRRGIDTLAHTTDNITTTTKRIWNDRRLLMNERGAVSLDFGFSGAANTAEEIPAVIYRGGGKSPSNFRLREGEDALSFRDSLSNPLPPGHPVMHPGREWVGLDTSKLPPGTVVPDGVPGSAVTPPGHVSVYVDDPMLLKDAIIESSKFPK